MIPKRRLDGLDIAPLRLYVSVCNTNWCYLTVPMLAVETSLGEDSQRLWTPPSTTRLPQSDDVLILCLAPFAFVLTTRMRTAWVRTSAIGRNGRSTSAPTRTSVGSLCLRPTSCRERYEPWSTQLTMSFPDVAPQWPDLALRRTKPALRDQRVSATPPLHDRLCEPTVFEKSAWSSAITWNRPLSCSTTGRSARRGGVCFPGRCRWVRPDRRRCRGHAGRKPDWADPGRGTPERVDGVR